MGYLRINQTQALIGLRSHYPQIGLKTRQPLLQLQGTQLEVSIHQEEARVRCDSSQTRYEMGYKEPAAFSRDNALKSMQMGLSYIGQVSREGDLMGRPERYDMADINRAYADLAWDDAADYNVARIPRSLVDIKVIPSKMEMGWQMGRVEGALQRGEVKVGSTRGKVDIYLRQQASLRIDYVETKFDEHV